MFIQARLISRSSRSLAVMTGYAQPGVGRGRPERRGRLLEYLCAGLLRPASTLRLSPVSP